MKVAIEKRLKLLDEQNKLDKMYAENLSIIINDLNNRIKKLEDKIYS